MQFEQQYCDQLCTKPLAEVEVVTKDKICSIVQQSLAKIIAKEGYKTYFISTKLISTEGGNYLGELYEIDVSGQTKNGPKVTNIFVKHVPKDDIITSTVCLNTCYYNELFAYNEFSNIANELYHEAAVPDEEKFKMAKFYPESNKHALIFKNLAKKGYKTYNRIEIMSIGFAKSAIKELAKFHALSIAMKEKRNDFFENYIKTLKTPIHFEKTEDGPNSSWKELVEKMTTVCFNHLEVDISNKNEKIKDLCNRFNEIMITNGNGKTASFKCLCHGDYRTNNILMKENVNGEVKTVTIDFQLLNYGSPIYDFLYFIYSATDRKFRKQHMEYLKNLYHDTLTEFVKYFDLDINSIYSRKEFEKDFEEKLEYGLLVSLFFLPFFLTEEPDIIKNGSNTDEETHSFHHSFKQRINEVFQEYIEWGIL